MSKPLSLGLNLGRKPGLSKPAPPKRKPIFGGDDGDSDDDGGPRAEAITTLTDAAPQPSGPKHSQTRRAGKGKGGPPPPPPSGPPKPKRPDGGGGGGGAGPAHALGDLASALTSRRYAERAEREDPSIYDYDAAYDAFKAPARNAAAAASAQAAERKPQYMANLKKAVEVRERDRKIAEDKKMKREREAEGDEFADKDMFVTEAYRKQQEENRRLEEEERRREEDEARRNKSGGMTGFYKQLLDRGEQAHAEMVRAAEELQHRKKTGGGGGDDKVVEDAAAATAAEEEDESGDKGAADKARRINEQGGDVAINEEGQVVDKRELLRGGLNIVPKKKQQADAAAAAAAAAAANYRERDRRDGGRGASSSSLTGRGGGRQAMRDRQSRALEAQYEQALKRSRDEAAEERAKVELASKSQKTAADISSAKERYLARKKAAAEAKAQGLPGEP
ncbi:hypothetical protein RB600_009597 [Gaeumannomyces tritici]